jgi:phosphoribosylformylglycinamidine synthase
MKVETHNHPTAIASRAHRPAQAAKLRRRRDRARLQAESRLAWLHGFKLFDSGGKPGHIASPLQIMTEGPLGGAAFNNEFGGPT